MVDVCIVVCIQGKQCLIQNTSMYKPVDSSLTITEAKSHKISNNVIQTPQFYGHDLFGAHNEA